MNEFQHRSAPKCQAERIAARDGTLHLAAVDRGNRALAQRLDGHRLVGFRHHAPEVARILEGVDLPAAVLEPLVQACDAVQEKGRVLRRLAGANDVGAGGDPTDMSGDRREPAQVPDVHAQAPELEIQQRDCGARARRCAAAVPVVRAGPIGPSRSSSPVQHGVASLRQVALKGTPVHAHRYRRRQGQSCVPHRTAGTMSQFCPFRPAEAPLLYGELFQRTQPIVVEDLSTS